LAPFRFDFDVDVDVDVAGLSMKANGHEKAEFAYEPNPDERFD
jgi:hypothetical protein